MTNDDSRRLREDAGPELRAALDAAHADGPTQSELKAIAAGLPGFGAPAATTGKPFRLWLVPGAAAAVAILLLMIRVLNHEHVNTIAEPVAPPVIHIAPGVVRDEPPPPPRAPPPAAATPVRVERPRTPHVVAPPAAPPPKELSEFELVDHAFRGGDAAGALMLVEEHARRFEHGALQQEREVLRIEALVQLGKNEAASRAFAAFEAAFPGSGHRVRILNLLDAGNAR